MNSFKQELKNSIPKAIFPLFSSWYFSLRFVYYRIALVPLKIRKKTTDRKVFNQIFLHKEYDITINFKPRFIIDAGANVGYAAVYFHRRYPKALIFAVEPERSNFETLKYNISKRRNIVCFNGGVWYKRGFLKIQNIGSDKWGFVTAEVEQGEQADIETITIDEIMEKSGVDQIDILKIDIEGAEKEVFSGNYNLWLPKVKMLIIETHDHIKAGCEKAVLTAISNYDFDEFSCGENRVFIQKQEA